MSKGQKTRERIIAKAAPLFNERGFEGASLAALMEATGLEKGGIYRHFPNKEAVALEAFDYAWELASKARLHDLDSVPHSVDKLKHFVANFVERPGPIAGGCPLLNAAIDSDDGNAALRDRAHAALGRWREGLASVVRAGIEKKEIRKQVDPKAVAVLIISSLEGALMICRLSRSRDSMRVIQSHLNRYLNDEVRRRSK